MDGVDSSMHVPISLQDEGNKKPEMKLNVPEILKVQLVDDWEAVTKNNQVGPNVFSFSEMVLKAFF